MNTVNREFACDDAKIPDVSDSYRLDGCGIDLKPIQADMTNYSVMVVQPKPRQADKLIQETIHEEETEEQTMEEVETEEEEEEEEETMEKVYHNNGCGYST